VRDSWLHEAICRQSPTVGDSWLHEAACGQRIQLWLTVGYMKPYVDRDLNCA